ncbi:hypothetical protein vseg_005897 [Gypsophila vaccaria]
MAGEAIDPKPNSPKIESSQIDSLSPYYLGNQDGPGATITHIKLRNDNYDEWSRSMKRSLKSRRKFGFCDGTIKKPTDAFYLEQWEVVNCTVVQWILHSIDPSIKDAISDYDEALPLWSELRDRYAVVDGTVIHSLKSQISDCKQTKGMSVTTYYGKLKVLWDALAIHEPPLACKCGKCTCEIASAATKRQDSERLHQFFMGLDLSLYGVLRSHQFQLDPLPSLSRAYHVVLQEERLRGPASTPDDPLAPDIMAFAVKNDTHYSGQDWRLARDREKHEKRKLLCSYCSSRGHDLQVLLL